LSEHMDAFIRRAMSPTPQQRPASCRSFVEELLGQSTPALEQTLPTLPSSDLWFVVYEDESGLSQKVKGTTVSVRRSLQDGSLGDPTVVRLSPNTDGPFEALENYAEFRDLLDMPAAENQVTLTTDTVRTPLTETALPATAAPSGPHIRIVQHGSSPAVDEVWKWLALLALALAAGTAGFYLMPWLTRLRLL
jgi:hypothetical protein